MIGLAFIYQNCGMQKTFTLETMETAVPLCRDVESAEVAPKLKWDWIKELSRSPDTRWPSFDQVMASPVVADLDGDQFAEVVFVSFSKSKNDFFADTAGSIYIRNGVLRIVDGRTGKTLKSIGEQELAPYGSQTPLLVDLDKDGKVEIVYLGYAKVKETVNKVPVYDKSRIIALNSDGSLRWQHTLPITLNFTPTGFSASDINLDGIVDIQVGPHVISEDNQRKPVEILKLNGMSVTHYGTLSTSLDSELKTQSLINLLGVYNVDGSQKFAFAHPARSIAVGDLFDDVEGTEVVTTTNGLLAIYDGVKGTELSKIDLTQHNDLICPSGGVGGGPPSIGDFDGDSATVEIAVATGRHLTIFNKQLVPIYKFVTQDCSSRITGLTSFDLNGDKKAEILYADEEYFRIYEIIDGELKERHKLVNPSGTLYEYPVVADIDNNFSADILVVANNYPAAGFYKDAGEELDAAEGLATTGLRAFSSSAERSWMPTRPIWTQFNFHPDQFTDRAQFIPFAETNLKMFRQNNQGQNVNLKCK